MHCSNAASPNFSNAASPNFSNAASPNFSNAASPNFSNAASPMPAIRSHNGTSVASLNAKFKVKYIALVTTLLVDDKNIMSLLSSSSSFPQQQSSLFVGNDPGSIAGFSSHFQLSSADSRRRRRRAPLVTRATAATHERSTRRHRWGATEEIGGDEMTLSGTALTHPDTH